MKFLSATKSAFLCAIALVATGFDAGAALVLTQSKVVETVLKNGLFVKMSELRAEAAAGRYQSDRSLYDTHLNVSAGYERDQSDQSIPVFGTDNKSQTFSASATQVFPSGTQASLSYSHLWQKTDSPFATLNPYYETAAMLSVRQPLLNNIFGKGDRDVLEASRLRFEALITASRREKEEAVFAAVLVYWEWTVRRQNAALVSQSLREAAEFEGLTRSSSPFGVYDVTDLLNATANRLRFAQQLSFARQLSGESRHRLLNLLNLDLGTDVVSSESPPPPTRVAGSDAMLANALAHRGDYQAALLRARSAKVGLEAAENGILPRIDAVASLKLNGIDGGYGSSLGETAGGDHPDYFVGGEVSFPLENRAAKGREREARAESSLARVEAERLRNDIAADIASLRATLAEQARQVGLARELESVTRQNWRAELERYRNGKSRADLVVRAQEQHLEAARNVIANLLAYRVSFTRLDLAQGILIPSAGMDSR